MSSLTSMGFNRKNFEKMMAMYRGIHDLLDDLDQLTRDLKSLHDKAKEDDDEKEEGSFDSDEVLGKGQLTKKKDVHSFITDGIDILVKKMAGDQAVIGDDELRRAMDKAYNPSRGNLFKRQLGTQDEEGNSLGADATISIERFTEFLNVDSKGNVGIGIAAICCCIIDRLQKAEQGLPRIIQEATNIATDLVQPLIPYAFSFGLLLSCEELRELVKEDPDEIAALEAEADEAAMENRMSLIKAFATDFKECFEHGFSPDPSLMVSIAIEASTSFIGLGPTTKRRIALLNAIIGIANIESDKKAIEKVDEDLKSELIVVQSMSGHQHSEILTKTLAQLDDHHGNVFDARKVLGDGEVADFWISSFGKDCYEVPWQRFRLGFVGFYGKASDKDLKRLKAMLLDTRGMVVLDQLKAFQGNEGSLSEALKQLGKPPKLPKSLGNVLGEGSTAGGAAR
jgi:hypothetical protein